MAIFVEHPRSKTFELFATPEPQERTDEHLRFLVAAPPRQETTLRVQERALRSRQEALLGQTIGGIRKYLDKGLLDRDTHDRIVELLHLWQKIREKDQALKQVEKDRQKIYQAQQQIQGNMNALGTQGKEGLLRTKYVDQLEAHEEQLQQFARKEEGLTAEMAKMKAELDTRLAAE